jgi:hypothetical protein
MHESKSNLKRRLVSLAFPLGATLLLGGVSIAVAALTFSNSKIAGDSSGVTVNSSSTIIIDASGTISIGTSTATAITIGNSNATTSFTGNVGIGNAAPRSALEVTGWLVVASGSTLDISDPSFGYPVNNDSCDGAGGFNIIIDGNCSSSVNNANVNLIIGGLANLATSGSNDNTIIGPGSNVTITGASANSTVLGRNASIAS